MQSIHRFTSACQVLLVMWTSCTKTTNSKAQRRRSQEEAAVRRASFVSNLAASDLPLAHLAASLASERDGNSSSVLGSLHAAAAAAANAAAAAAVAQDSFGGAEQMSGNTFHSTGAAGVYGTTMHRRSTEGIHAN